MMRALWTAGSGMRAQQLNIDVIAHNLANVNTTGFKKSRVEFQDLIYETMRGAGTRQGNASAPVGLQVGHGVRPAATQRLFSPGSLQEREPDSHRRWVFEVELPTAWPTPDGVWVDADGYRLPAMAVPVPEIMIPRAQDISIGPDGTITTSWTGAGRVIRSSYHLQ